jgi:hypothetical protein
MTCWITSNKLFRTSQMINSMLKRETFFLLPTKILLDQQEQLGELFLLSSKKKNLKDLKTCNSLEITRHNSKKNYPKNVKILLISLIKIFFNKALSLILILKYFILKWREITIDISPNMPKLSKKTKSSKEPMNPTLKPPN